MDKQESLINESLLGDGCDLMDLGAQREGAFPVQARYNSSSTKDYCCSGAFALSGLLT